MIYLNFLTKMPFSGCFSLSILAASFANLVNPRMTLRHPDSELIWNAIAVALAVSSHLETSTDDNYLVLPMLSFLRRL